MVSNERVNPSSKCDPQKETISFNLTQHMPKVTKVTQHMPKVTSTNVHQINVFLNLFCLDN